MHHHRGPISANRRERGASAIEYALLLALIAVVTFSAVSFFGSSSKAGYGNSQSCISAAYDGQPLPADCKQ